MTVITINSTLDNINPASNSKEAYLSHAAMRNNIGDLSGAINDCTLAIRIDPNYLEAYLDRFKYKYYINDYIGALEDLMIADGIESTPTFFNELNNKTYENLFNVYLEGSKDQRLAFKQVVNKKCGLNVSILKVV